MQPGSTYHLFNHANGWENLFKEHKNYDFFLERLSLHVLPVANIYAYCLMPNHFHLLLKIREENELIRYFRFKNEQKIIEQDDEELPQNANEEMEEGILIKKVSKSFSNLFNSYTQAFNKMYERKGSLFMPNIKKEEVNNDGSFCKVVHHQFVKSIDKWPHSSYKIFLSKSPTKLEREYVVDMFGGIDWLIKYHQQPIDPKNKWLDF